MSKRRDNWTDSQIEIVANAPKLMGCQVDEPSTKKLLFVIE